MFREEHGRVIASLIAVFGDFDVAEEAVQSAFVTTLDRWPHVDLPLQPSRLDNHDRQAQGHRLPSPRPRPR